MPNLVTQPDVTRLHPPILNRIRGLVLSFEYALSSVCLRFLYTPLQFSTGQYGLDGLFELTRLCGGRRPLLPVCNGITNNSMSRYSHGVFSAATEHGDCGGGRGGVGGRAGAARAGGDGGAAARCAGWWQGRGRG